MALAPRNRVLQLDGSSLDDQTRYILEEQLREAISDGSLPLSVQRIASRYSEEFKLLIRLALFKLFLWDTSTTYGLLMQNLKLSNKKVGARLKLTKIAKLILLIQVLFGYIVKKLNFMMYDEDWMASLRERHPNVYSILTNKHVERCVLLMNKFFKIGEIVNAILFLLTGNFASLLHRICGIKHERVDETSVAFASNPQSISYEFQDRQLFWNGITEFLEHVQLPNWRWTWKGGNNDDDTHVEGNAQFKFLPERCCAFCYRDDGHGVVDSSLITNCYVLPCGHGYCYMCVMREMERLEGKLRCLRCGEVALSAEPL